MYFISSKSKYSNLRFIANKKDLSRPTQIHSLVWIFAVSIMATSGRKIFKHTICYSKYSDRQAWENTVDPLQRLQNKVPSQSLLCLPLIQIFRHINNYWNNLVQM